jgi:hypothetical protein
MKHTSLFRMISLLTLLLSLVASPSGALASSPAQGTGPTATIRIDSAVMSLAATTIGVGSTVTYAIDLQNLPAEGLTSADFACRYDATIVEVSNLVKTDIFGSNAITAINGPSGGTFVFAIAGLNQRATTGGTVFRLDMKGLKAGSFNFDCVVRASKDGSTLFSIPFTPVTITVGAPVVNGTVNGVVTASKAVTVTLLSGSTVVTSVTAANNGSFSLTAPAGTYSITASAAGFLTASRGSVTVTAGGTTTMTTIALAGGDINTAGTSANKIDADDVLTIGINYNKTTPTIADLNNDGIINVLDLQIMAPNYGKTGPTTW